MNVITATPLMQVREMFQPIHPIWMCSIPISDRIASIRNPIPAPKIRHKQR